MTGAPALVEQPVFAPGAGVLEHLRARLDDADYATVYRLSGGDLYMRTLPTSLRESVAALPRATRTCIGLFALDETVTRAEAEHALGADLVASLEAAALLFPSGAHGLTSRHRIDLAGDTWLLTENYLGHADRVYFGEDSQFLHGVLEPRAGGVCLDLCTGSGIQGLRLAAAARHVDMVDVNPRAAHLAALNADLNGLSARVRVHSGDLWDALPPGARYDLVVANPPLVPVPDGVPYPICGDGGADGLTLVRRLVEQLPQRLESDGRAAVIGASTGVGGEPSVVDVGRKLHGAGLDVTLYLLYRLPLYDWVTQIATSAAAMQPGYRAAQALARARAVYGTELDVMQVHTYLLKVARRARAPRWRMVDYTAMNRRSYWFVGSRRS